MTFFQLKTAVTSVVLILILSLQLVSRPVMAADKTCSVNGAIGWYPILFRTEEQVNGIALDVLRSFENGSDISFQLRSETPWARVEDNLKKGQLDLIAGAYYTKRRTEFAHYSQAFFNEEISIFTSALRQFPYAELSDLVGRTGIRPANGSYGERFDSFATRYLKLQQIIGTDTMLRMLLADRADYVVLAKLDGLNWLKKMRLSKRIVNLPKPAAVNDVFFLVGKNSECKDVLNDLNQHINHLRSSGKWQSILSKY